MPDRLTDKRCPYDNSTTTLTVHNDGEGVGFKLECDKCGSNKISAKPVGALFPNDNDLIQTLSDSWL